MNLKQYYIIMLSGVLFFALYDLFKSKDFKDSFFDLHQKRTFQYIVAAIILLGINGFVANSIRSLIPSLFNLKPYQFIDFLGCIFFGELLTYTLHYIKHNSFFWKFHFPHHISNKYSVLLTTNVHFFDVIVSGVIVTFFNSLIGFSNQAIYIYLILYTVINHYHHSSFNSNIGFLNKIIVTPAYHMVHHSKSHKGNYSNTFTFWDIIFNTVIWPTALEEKIEIGINNKGEPFGFKKEFLYFLKK